MQIIAYSARRHERLLRTQESCERSLQAYVYCLYHTWGLDSSPGQKVHWYTKNVLRVLPIKKVAKNVLLRRWRTSLAFMAKMNPTVRSVACDTRPSLYLNIASQASSPSVQLNYILAGSEHPCLLVICSFTHFAHCYIHHVLL